MRRLKPILAGALAAAGAVLPGTAFAQIVETPSAQGEVAVTIYNNNLALVQDKRELRLPAGKSKQDFPDVAAQIRPETVTLSAPGAAIVEQNFDFDLLTPEALMEKAVGQNVTVVREGKSMPAKVLAYNNGAVVEIGGRIEVLNEKDRVVFPSLPPSLRARPTLSVTLDAEAAGPRPATLSYLTSGMSWKSDYVALFDEKAGKIDVQGWLTLTNNSGTTYANASTLLVAGVVGNSGERGGPRYGAPRRGSLEQAGTETAGREQLGDFYVYPIPGRITIAQRQQKQVSFLNVAGAPAARVYAFRNPWLGRQDQARSVDTVLRFSSSKEGGLGDALPAGTVRIYMRDARGAPQFIGENNIGHTPMGSRLGIKTGEAFDVKVKVVVQARERLDDFKWRTTMAYTLTNARPEAVTVELSQGGLDSWWKDTRILSESLKSERVDADETLWKVSVPANGEASVTATFETRY
ncbi:DUF4139 domain-containing protein [Sphingomonas sp. BT-65]|uniref:DUF4139 domain-containing protein n=1 Tax=Sphingomonas sp. BT-65 TaxID=2989821 RepID=UPI0022355AB4|nr:DUF4139 domain-containing protein [Sphingomonas sp. BT-65]MCW4463377.1 DUF4139 domain-containing protein [Sphingomonas sp. BT-65]